MKWAVALALSVLTLAAQTPAPPAATVNSIGMAFVRIEPGTMQVGVFHPDCENGGGGRGAPRDPRMVWVEADRAACEAQTRADRRDGFPVTIRKAYLIGKTEVTQGRWKAVMRTNPSLFQADRVTNPDNHPVESVSWQDAQAFVKALNAKEKTRTYRLPTEFEWEYACRAGGPGQQTWTEIRAQAVLGLGLGLAGRGAGGRGSVPAAPSSEPLPPETLMQYSAHRQDQRGRQQAAERLGRARYAGQCVGMGRRYVQRQDLSRSDAAKIRIRARAQGGRFRLGREERHLRHSRLRTRRPLRRRLPHRQGSAVRTQRLVQAVRLPHERQ